MSLPKLLFVGCASLTFCLTICAADPSSATIELLIKQLGSRQFRTREAANSALATTGAVAIPALRRAAVKAADPEIRHRAAILVAAFDARHVSNLICRVLQRQCSPTQKGRAIKPLLHPGMSEREIRRLLGPPTYDIEIWSSSEGFFRGAVYANLCLTIDYSGACDKLVVAAIRVQ